MTKTIIIDGKETNYTISDKGEVYNTKTKKYLKGTYKRNEYHTVQLTIDKQTKTVMTHRLVAEAIHIHHTTQRSADCLPDHW